MTMVQRAITFPSSCSFFSPPPPCKLPN
jgi:hypothetical protein